MYVLHDMIHHNKWVLLDLHLSSIKEHIVRLIIAEVKLYLLHKML